MSRFISIYRASVPTDNVAQLLAIRGEAIDEARKFCSALVGADLVRLGDGTWLDILTWDQPNGEELLMAHAHKFAAMTVMHGLIADATGPETGAVEHSVRG